MQARDAQAAAAFMVISLVIADVKKIIAIIKDSDASQSLLSISHNVFKFIYYTNKDFKWFGSKNAISRIRPLSSLLYRITCMFRDYLHLNYQAGAKDSNF
jgi:hypothetical protein